MIKPTPDTIRAILTLESNVFWKEIVGWIEKSLIKQSLANNNFSGENTIKGQGRNMELDELLKYINEAHNYEQNAKDAKRMEKGG
jgi:hypothetical protein